MKNIHARVKHLFWKYNTRDPKRIARELGIEIIYKPFSDYTKGIYYKVLRNKYIVINSNLPESIQRIVLAHELGHALLHSNQNIYFIREYTLFPTGVYENEANQFAAELLIDEKEIDIRQMSIGEISSYFEVPEQLVAFKFIRRC